RSGRCTHVTCRSRSKTGSGASSGAGGNPARGTPRGPGGPPGSKRTGTSWTTGPGAGEVESIHTRGWTFMRKLFALGMISGLAACGGDGGAGGVASSDPFCQEVIPRVAAFMAEAGEANPTPDDERYGGS